MTDGGAAQPMTDLIYDNGAYHGEDSEFYLLKGFRVVAVEADPDLCRFTAHRLSEFVATGQLTIVNRAIAPGPGPLIYYRSSTPEWGTVVPEWNADLETRGVRSEPIIVEGVTLADLAAEYGDAFYMKLDIEGMDRRAIESLEGTAIRPKYVSMETTFSRVSSFDAIGADFDTLARLGYDRFKIVDQSSVQRQPAPDLAARGVPFRFAEGSSGLFGEEAPGDWQSAAEALAGFKRLLRGKWLQMRLYRRPLIYSHYCTIMSRLTGTYPNLGWFDIHARHASVE